jgi:hypothetical protein
MVALGSERSSPTRFEEWFRHSAGSVARPEARTAENPPALHQLRVKHSSTSAAESLHLNFGMRKRCSRSA